MLPLPRTRKAETRGSSGSKTGSAKIAAVAVGGVLLAAAFLKLTSTDAEGKMTTSWLLISGSSLAVGLGSGRAANGMYCREPSGTIRMRFVLARVTGPSNSRDSCRE